MARSLYKMLNNNGSPIDFGTVTVNPSEELVIFNRAKSYTQNAGDILREKINEGVLVFYRLDETILTAEEAHDSITTFENNFGKLSAAALQLPEVKRDFYKAALKQLEDEIYLENQNLEDERLTEQLLIDCNNGLLLSAEDELNNMVPNATWTVELINKYKSIIEAIKV